MLFRNFPLYSKRNFSCNYKIYVTEPIRRDSSAGLQPLIRSRRIIPFLVSPVRPSVHVSGTRSSYGSQLDSPVTPTSTYLSPLSIVYSNPFITSVQYILEYPGLFLQSKTTFVHFNSSLYYRINSLQLLIVLQEQKNPNDTEDKYPPTPASPSGRPFDNDIRSLSRGTEPDVVLSLSTT